MVYVKEYVYSFVVWPNETYEAHPQALFDYFRKFRRCTEMIFTEDGFRKFRAEMASAGFRLAECIRRPNFPLEPVY